MARACSICRRPDAGAINALLGEGRSARSVAVELRLSEDAVQRHAKRHRRTGPERRDAAPPNGDPLDELVDALRARALAGDPQLVHQYRLALAAQANEQRAAAPARELATDPEWIALRTRMLAALARHPKARQAVADALADMAR